MITFNLSHLKTISGSIHLPASKSISNRLQIMSAIAGDSINIQNLSTARDSQIMKAILASSDSVKNVQDAGTAMRFLTAFYAIGNKEVILKGTDRMHQRPIGVLVDALNSLGANIHYIEMKGFPPLKINPFQKIIACQELEVDSTISSQYISALLMVSPKLPNGLWLKLKGNVASKPYIKMTLALMGEFGVEHRWLGDKIYIPHGNYSSGEHKVEADWSAASYWYAILCVMGRGELLLYGLNEKSLQGDQKVVEIFRQLGVETKFEKEGARIFITDTPTVSNLELDFADCPDLAQTLAVVCSVKGIELTMKNVESLKIKETDRIKALQSELEKIGATMMENDSSYIIKSENITSLSKPITIETYSDHRMAMAFASVSLLGEVSFYDESVVNKSYPEFWDELSSLI